MRATFPKTGKALRKLRERAGLSQVSLAKTLKCHPQFVSNWERGKCAPPKHSLKKLAKVLKLKKADKFYLWCELISDANANFREEYRGLV